MLALGRPCWCSLFRGRGGQVPSGLCSPWVFFLIFIFGPPSEGHPEPVGRGGCAWHIGGGVASTPYVVKDVGQSAPPPMALALPSWPMSGAGLTSLLLARLCRALCLLHCSGRMVVRPPGWRSFGQFVRRFFCPNCKLLVWQICSLPAGGVLASAFFCSSCKTLRSGVTGLLRQRSSPAGA